MKKILTLLVVAGFSAALVGCGEPAKKVENKPGAAPTSDKPKEGDKGAATAPKS